MRARSWSVVMDCLDFYSLPIYAGWHSRKSYSGSGAGLHTEVFCWRRLACAHSGNEFAAGSGDSDSRSSHDVSRRNRLRGDQDANSEVLSRDGGFPFLEGEDQKRPYRRHDAGTSSVPGNLFAHSRRFLLLGLARSSSHHHLDVFAASRFQHTHGFFLWT